MLTPSSLPSQAPVHHGPTALKLYIARLAALPSLVTLSAPSSPLSLIKSFRYLLEDSPAGFMSSPSFIAGLQYLGSQGFAFDLTVDSVNQQGVLTEVVETIFKVREGQPSGEETVFILDHFAKPNLVSEVTVPPSAQQSAYLSALFELALMPRVYLKLSALLNSADPELVKGALAEYRARQGAPPLPPSGREGGGGTPSASPFAQLTRRVLTFLEPALESFGESRILVGSGEPD